MNTLSKFSAHAISRNEMKVVKGGRANPCLDCQNCINSNAGACKAAGFEENTGGYDTCIVTLRTECENQSYCQGCSVD